MLIWPAVVRDRDKYFDTPSRNFNVKDIAGLPVFV